MFEDKEFARDADGTKVSFVSLDPFQRAAPKESDEEELLSDEDNFAQTKNINKVFAGKEESSSEEED